MQYNTKIVIKGAEVLNEASASLPYITNVKLEDNNAQSALEIGATGASRLTFTMINPFAESFDGDKVELWVSSVDNGIKSLVEQIDEEVGETTGEEVITDDDIEGEDDDETGETMTDEEVAEAEAEIQVNEEDQYNFFQGEAETVTADTTDEAEEAEWTKIATMYVYQQTNGSNMVNITAVDGFCLMTDIFTPSSASASCQVIYDDFKAQMLSRYNIAVEAETMPEKDIYWITKTTFRQAAGYFAGLVGGYATFDADGVLNICQYTYGDNILIKEEALSYTPSSSGETMLGALTCGELSVGAGQSVTIDNPYIDEDMLTDILAKYNGIRFEGATIVSPWNPSLQSGEFAKVMSADEYRAYAELQNEIDLNGVTDELMASINSIGSVVLVNSQTITFDGEAMARINSAATSETQKQSGIPRNLVQAIQEAAKSATNYIGIDTDGSMVISRDTDDTQMRLDADSLDIEKGGETIASFGANEIQLGTAADEAKVTMCDALEISSKRDTFGDVKLDISNINPTHWGSNSNEVNLICVNNENYGTTQALSKLGLSYDEFDLVGQFGDYGSVISGKSYSLAIRLNKSGSSYYVPYCKHALVMDNQGVSITAREKRDDTGYYGSTLKIQNGGVTIESKGFDGVSQINLNGYVNAPYGITIGGHATPIGTRVELTEKTTSSLASATSTSVLSNTVTVGAGTYIVCGTVEYGSKSGARRHASVGYKGNGASSWSYSEVSYHTMIASSTGVIRVNTVTTLVFPNDNNTIAICGWQNSGSAISATAKGYVTRIA